MPSTKEQSDWVARVLGVGATAAAAQDPLRATLTGLIGKAGKIAGVVRPTGPPRQLATNRLLNAIGGQPVPEDPADAPAHVADFLPGFLVSVEAERPVASQKLAAGAAVPGPDQMLGIADLFAAVQRSMIEWENLLDKAETEEHLVDTLEDQAEDRDQAEYADTLVTYNARRNDSITAEARAAQLMTELQARFSALSEAQRNAATQGNTDA